MAIDANYTDATAITATGLASLGSTTADPPAGYELGDVDNTTNLFLDALLRGKIKTGTSPTANRQIIVCVYGVLKASGPTLYRPAGVTGSAGALTLATAGAVGALGVCPIAIIPTSSTSDQDYNFGPFSVKKALGMDELPPYWGVFVFHNTAVALNGTGSNFTMHYQGIKRTVT